jgi:formylglycine-generating enzyme required for sulfatase activity
MLLDLAVQEVQAQVVPVAAVVVEQALITMAATLQEQQPEQAEVLMVVMAAQVAQQQQEQQVLPLVAVDLEAQEFQQQMVLVPQVRQAVRLSNI